MRPDGRRHCRASVAGQRMCRRRCWLCTGLLSTHLLRQARSLETMFLSRSPIQSHKHGTFCCARAQLPGWAGEVGCHAGADFSGVLSVLRLHPPPISRLSGRRPGPQRSQHGWCPKQKKPKGSCCAGCGGGAAAHVAGNFLPLQAPACCPGRSGGARKGWTLSRALPASPVRAAT